MRLDPGSLDLNWPRAAGNVRARIRALVMSLFLMAALAAAARVPLQKLDRTVVSGSEYIRLDDWADGAGFNMKWAKKEGTITLSNASAQWVLTVDSRRAEICGVNVWLSLPVVNRSGAILLSLVDAGTTVEPILFPQRSDARLNTICLDPGHGGKDKGEISRHNYEKTYTLLLAREVEGLLRRAGFKVVLTRERDAFVDLPDRSLMARREGADLFVSLHYNSANDDIRGLEVYCLTPAGVHSSNEGGGKAPRLPEAGNAHDNQNVLLAYEMQKTILTSLRMEDRGMKRSRFEVLREAGMPAILIEGGFMSNAADAKNIYDAAFRARMAQAIVDGILAYKKTVERP
jgi:N-acetylmuramoyl-L-alanine amidase